MESLDLASLHDLEYLMSEMVCFLYIHVFIYSTNRLKGSRSIKFILESADI